MATPDHDFTHPDTFTLASQGIEIGQLLLPAVPEFLGALAAALVSTAVSWALQKRRKAKRGTPAATDDLPRAASSNVRPGDDLEALDNLYSGTLRGPEPIGIILEAFGRDIPEA